MRKVAPCVSILAVVFTNRAPLPLAKIGTPLSPRRLAIAGFFKSGRFRILRHFCTSALLRDSAWDAWIDDADVVNLGPLTADWVFFAKGGYGTTCQECCRNSFSETYK